MRLDGLRAQRLVTSGGLVLEPLRVEDATEMLGVLSDPDLYAFIGGAPPSAEQLTDRYERQVAGPGREDEVWLNWVIRGGDDPAAVGFVQATLTRDGGEWTAEVAWVVGTQFQGRGIATAAADAVLEHLAHVGVRRFRARIADANAASVSVATRLGFTPTDVLDADGERLFERPPAARAGGRTAG